MPLVKRRSNLVDLITIGAVKSNKLIQSRLKVTVRHLKSSAIKPILKTLKKQATADESHDGQDIDEESRKKQEESASLQSFLQTFFPKPLLDISHVAQFILELKFMKFLRFCAVILAAITIGYDASLGINKTLDYVNYTLDTFVNYYFIAEGFLKVVALLDFIIVDLEISREKTSYGSILRHSGLFDLCLGILCIKYRFDLNGSNIGGFLRLARLFIILLFTLEYIPQLDVLLMGISNGIRAIMFALLLILLALVVYGAAAMPFFKENDPFHFGTFAIAVWTFFEMSTLDNWSDVLYINTDDCNFYPSYYIPPPTPNTPSNFKVGGNGFYYPYCSHPQTSKFVAPILFISFVFVCGFILMNLAISAVATGVHEHLDNLRAEEDLNEMHDKKVFEKLQKEFLQNAHRMTWDEVFQQNQEFKSVFWRRIANDNKLLAQDPILIRKKLRLLWKPVPKNGLEQLAFEAKNPSKKYHQHHDHAATKRKFKGMVAAVGVLFGLHHHRERVIPSGADGELSQNQNSDSNRTKIKQKNNSNRKKENKSDNRNDKTSNNPIGKGQSNKVDVEEGSEKAKANREAIVMSNSSSRKGLTELPYIEEDEGDAEDMDEEDCSEADIGLPVIHDNTPTHIKLLHTLRRLIMTESYSQIINLLVILAATAYLYEVTYMDDIEPYDHTDKILIQLNLSFQIVFSVDLLLRLVAVFPLWQEFFSYGWNVFDSFLILVLWIPVAQPHTNDKFLGVLRILRIIRIFKILSRFSDFELIMESLTSSARALLYLLFMIAALFFHFAVGGVYLFAKNDPFHFDSLSASFKTLFQCITYDNWQVIARIQMFGCDVFGYDSGLAAYDDLCRNPHALGWTGAWFFIFFIILSNQILLNLFIGVIITSMDLIREERIEEKDINQRIILVKELYGIDDVVERRMMGIYDLLDCNNNGRLTVYELEEMFNILGITQEIFFTYFMRVDTNSSGKIDFPEFCELLCLLREDLGGEIIPWNKGSDYLRLQFKFAVKKIILQNRKNLIKTNIAEVTNLATLNIRRRSSGVLYDVAHDSKNNISEVMSEDGMGDLPPSLQLTKGGRRKSATASQFGLDVGTETGSNELTSEPTILPIEAKNSSLCLLVIRNLAANQSVRNELGSIGACEAVTNTIIRHKREENVDAGANAVISLCQDHTANQKIFIGSGIELILSDLNEDVGLTLTTRHLTRKALEAVLHPEKSDDRPLGVYPSFTNIAGTDVLHMQLDDYLNILKYTFASPTDTCLLERAFAKLPIVVGEDREVHRLLGTTVGVAEGFVKLLQASLKSATLCCEALKAIQQLCRLGRDPNTACIETIVLLTEAGVCETVLSVMSLHKHSIDVIIAGCKTICYLVTNNDEDTCNRFFEHNVCQSLLGGLRTHRKSGHVTEIVFETIVRLALDETHIDRMMSDGLGQIIVTTLRQYMSVVTEKHIHKVISAGFHAIRNLAINETHRTEFGNLGACEVMVSALKTHGYYPDVVDSGCGALVQLIVNHPDNRHRMIRSKADIVLNSVHLNFRLSATAREHARVTVEYLNGVRTDPHEFHISSDRVSTKDISVVEDAAQMLNLAIRDPTDTILVENAVRNIQKVVTGDREKLLLMGSFEGVVKNLVDILRRHIASETVTLQCLICLRFLCRYGDGVSTCCRENIIKINEFGGCETVIQVVSSHLNSKSVVEEGCRTIAYMILKDYEPSYRKLVDAGSCELIVRILQEYGQKEPTVANAALEAIANLATRDSMRITFSEAGVCPLVVQLLQEYTSGRRTASKFWNHQSSSDLISLKSNDSSPGKNDVISYLEEEVMNVLGTDPSPSLGQSSNDPVSHLPRFPLVDERAASRTEEEAIADRQNEGTSLAVDDAPDLIASTANTSLGVVDADVSASAVSLKDDRISGDSVAIGSTADGPNVTPTSLEPNNHRAQEASKEFMGISSVSYEKNGFQEESYLAGVNNNNSNKARTRKSETDIDLMQMRELLPGDTDRDEGDHGEWSVNEQRYLGDINSAGQPAVTAFEEDMSKASQVLGDSRAEETYGDIAHPLSQHTSRLDFSRKGSEGGNTHHHSGNINNGFPVDNMDEFSIEDDTDSNKSSSIMSTGRHDVMHYDVVYFHEDYDKKRKLLANQSKEESNSSSNNYNIDNNSNSSNSYHNEVGHLKKFTDKTAGQGTSGRKLAAGFGSAYKIDVNRIGKASNNIEGHKGLNDFLHSDEE